MMRTARSGVLIFALTAAIAAGASAQQEVDRSVGASLQGRVLDAESGAPISGVVVRFEAALGSALTGSDGRFTIDDVPPGDYSIRLTHVAYDEVVGFPVTVRASGVTPYEASMTPSVYRLKDLVVTPGAFSFGSRVAARQTMTREEIESVPQFAEDIFRAVNRFPGLASGDFTAQFSIRGSRSDETLILFDGLEIFEPYHLKDFNEGAIGIFDSEVIDGVDLMTGGFPVEHGNRSGGVMSVTSRTPVGQGTSYSFGASLTNARARVEGTFDEGKGSWFVSGRRGYLDLVLGILGESDLASPVFYDVFSKVKYAFTPSHSLSFNVLHAKDSWTLDVASTTGFRDSLRTTETANNRYGNSYVWLNQTAELGSRVAVRNILSASFVDRNRDGAETFVDIADPLYAVQNTRDLTVFGFKQDWEFDVAAPLLFRAGVDARRQDASYFLTTLVGPNPDDLALGELGDFPKVDSSSVKRDGTSIGAYLAARVRLADPFAIELGGRYDGASHSGDRDWSPRANALFRLGAQTNFRFGWGYFRQQHAIEDLAIQNDQVDYFPSELSEQWTGGIEHFFAGGGRLRLEGYLKDGSSLRPRFRNWKGGIDVFPESNEDRILVFPESSKGKGLELYFDKQISSRLAIRAGYSLAAIDERLLRVDNVNGATPLPFVAEHPAPRDQRHALNLDFTYRPNEKWSVNGALSYHTGWPATLEAFQNITAPDGSQQEVILPLTLWGERLPTYYRFDVRVTRRIPWRRGQMRLFFEVSNLTNHSNVWGYDYFRFPDANGVPFLRRDEEKWFPILPSLGISWSGGS